MTKTSRFALALVASLALFGSFAYAKNIHVPREYPTISEALGNADSGDSVLVARGVYNENITMVMGVVLKGEDPLTTIIDGGRRGPTVMGTTESEMFNFTIRNGIEGVLCENASPYIHHTYIVDNHATGLSSFIALANVRNNVIVGNRWSGLLIWGAKSLDASVAQNVVMRNGYSGLTLKGPSNIKVTNNIFMENHYYGIYADPAAGQTQVDYNDIYQNYYPFNRFIKVNRTNVSLDPMFHNASLWSPNFFVQDKSPMLKRGQKRLDIGLLKVDVVQTKEPDDTDQDGIYDEEDKCPTIKGETTYDGCPPPTDSDGDGIGDDEDACPNDPGVAANNGCAAVAAAATDTDGDGIPDNKDKCPGEAGVASHNGCNPPPPPKKQFVVEGINFESGKATLTEDSKPNLMTVVEMMKEYPEVTFLVVGHTDNQGKKATNQKLSEERAQAVVDFLTENGIEPLRLSAEGKGPDLPIATNKTAAGRAKNRRIEFNRTDSN
jgi:outer membrane protein OmpA-like peptidoglycan-associated protein